jgi:hypothetical protein
MGRGSGLLATLAVAAIILPMMPQPALASSELFKTSSGDTTADIRISTPPGFNDSVTFTLPPETLVLGARFQMSSMPVTITENLTETSDELRFGAVFQNVMVDNGSLRLSDEKAASDFSEWRAFTGCFTAATAGCLTLARDMTRMRFTPNLRPSPSNQSEYDPVVAAGSADEVYLAWCDNREFDYNIYFARSLDGGASFIDSRRINDDSGTGKARQEFPEIAAGPGKMVAVVWTDNRSGDEDTYIAASADSGASFGRNWRVDDGPSGTNQSHPSIAVTSSGRVAVAWEDDRGGAKNIRCAFSNDGQTFGPSVQVNTDNSGNEHFRPRLAAGTSGFHAVWYDNRSGAPNSTDFNIYYARSSGNGFLTDVRVDDSTNKTFQALPSIAVGPQEKVHVVWHDTRYGPFRIFHSSSQDGITFSANTIVNKQDSPQYQPRASVGPDGVLHVVWHDYRSSEPDIYYANSTSGGLSFNAPVRVDDGPIEVLSYAPAIAVNALGVVHVVWWDNRTQASMGSRYQLFYSRGIHPYYSAGSYETGALDIGTEPSAMMSVCATASQPPSTLIRVFLRTAPVSGGSWSDWEMVGYCSTQAPKPITRPGQMIRWRFELETQWYDSAPSVSSVILSYLFHPPSGTFFSRPIYLPYPLRLASVNLASGRLGDGRAEMSLQLSADNGSRWAEARPGMPVQFTGAGKVLLYRIDLAGSSSITPTLSSIFLDLRMESLPSDVSVSVGRSSTAAWTLPGVLQPGAPLSSPELQVQFDKVVQEARRTGRETAIIRLNISSSAPGILRISDIRILYDLPPEFVLLEPGKNVATDEGGAVTFTVDARDPDNDALSFMWTMDGSQTQTGGTNYVYRPDYTESGLRNITVAVSDGTLTAAYSWSVTVRDVNRPPEVKMASPECKTSMWSMDTARFEVRVSDPDGDILTYDWTAAGLPTQGEQDYYDFTAPAQPGTYEISVNISDGKDRTAHSWTVEVLHRPTNPAPEPPASPWPLVLGIALLAVAVAAGARLAMERRRRGRHRMR